MPVPPNGGGGFRNRLPPYPHSIRISREDFFLIRFSAGHPVRTAERTAFSANLTDGRGGEGVTDLSFLISREDGRRNIIARQKLRQNNPQTGEDRNRHGRPGQGEFPAEEGNFESEQRDFKGRKHS